jgi:LysR family transcriptional regulator (chromosome initiation inhibitor)
MLDYKLVEAFAVVVKEGGFEKAARVLHLTQSAVSQRLKLLEEQVGCILLVRSIPPRPTASGRQMLKHYRQVKRLEEDFGHGPGSESGDFTSLSVGINADSLATWFFPAINAFLDAEPVLLDLSVDDQAQTHRLLRDGKVLGCVGERSQPIQGCRVEYLGNMVYRLYATSQYRDKWFPFGITLEGMKQAPILIFNRKDAMHRVLISDKLGQQPEHLNGFYLPSSEKFAPTIASGRVCGMLPDQQAGEYLERGEIVDIIPGFTFTVALHWHCWNLESVQLGRFTEALVKGARRELKTVE